MVKLSPFTVIEYALIGEFPPVVTLKEIFNFDFPLIGELKVVLLFVSSVVVVTVIETDGLTLEGIE